MCFATTQTEVRSILLNEAIQEGDKYGMLLPDVKQSKGRTQQTELEFPNGDGRGAGWQVLRRVQEGY